MKKVYIYIILLLLQTGTLIAQVTVSGSNGADGSYSSLTVLGTGAFSSINGASQSGKNIVITISGNSLSETGETELNSGLWTSLIIYPVSSGLSISGNINNSLIGLNGADNVTIDGRVNASGSSTDLTLNNTNTGVSSSTILFINSAENNTIKYCNIKGSSLGLTNAIVLFTIALTGNGNDGNIIEYNNISGNLAARPINTIYSSGTSGHDNSGVIVRNNNIFDFLNNDLSSNGIYLSTNSSNWTVSGNSFYETTSFVPTSSSSYYIIRIKDKPGINFSIADNFIGGTLPNCGGSSWVKTNAFDNSFTGIYLYASQITPSNIQNNIIRNFDWSNSLNSSWTGIQIAEGDVNIGTTTGNTIGSSTGVGSILITSQTSGNSVYGINITGSGDVDCRNNIIGSITIANTVNNSCTFFGINKNASGGTTNIINNIIGSTSTANSILASSASTTNGQYVIGVNTSGKGTININNNTIANLNNGSTNSSAATLGRINGIASSSGTNTISGNIIHDLTIGNANSANGVNASVCGISLSGSTLKNIIGNSIYNLSNTNTSFAGYVLGMLFNGSLGGNSVSGNFIRDLSVSGSSTAASLTGIWIASGYSTFSNNIISLGGNTLTAIFGIVEAGTASSNNSIFYNTIYLGGNPASGTNPSVALYSASTSSIRDFRNNILVNARSTTGGSDLHYALFIPYIGGTLTCDYNDYFVSGTGGVIGYYGGLKTSLPIVSGQDVRSLSVIPGFALPGGSTAADYIPSDISLIAVTGTGILSDYAGITRSLTFPSMGAHEITIGPPVTNVDIYKGGILQASYLTIKEAFDAFNNGTHNTGAFEIRLTGNTNESNPAFLNASGTGSANYSSITIFPTIPGLTISGDLAAPLIYLNGADNVTIDGRVNATGNTIDLTIDNINTSNTAGTSTIRFINDATNNTVKYCNIKGSSTGISNGIILFGTTTGTTGNDNNTIDNNNITNSTDANRPVNAVYSAGTVSMDNSGNLISNNNIFNVLNRGIASFGVNIAANNSAWTISGNSFFETTPLIPTASVAYNLIIIDAPTGVNFTVTNNFIGGRSALCGGSAFTKNSTFDNIFYGININAGVGTASNIQNNTIRNIAWSNSLNGTWTGIMATGGTINIGTTTGNTIGNLTGNGSILITSSTTNNNVFGITISSTGTTNCRNNNIGSITCAGGSANGSNICGIYKTSTAGTTTISNNFIGSTATTNSIYASSISSSNAQAVYGIYNSGTGSITIAGNTISNLTNGTTNTTLLTQGKINGITSTSGALTITGNLINDLTISNANNLATNNASVCGIALSGAGVKTIASNKIYNLINNYSIFAGNVIGIYFTGGTGNSISSNFIHSFSVNAGSSASIHGIKIATGSSTYSNNIISLGGNSNTTIYGIYQTGTTGTNSLFFNTVYIGGSSSSTSYFSYGIYSVGTANIRDFRNNVLVNARSTPGGANQHYALFIASAGGTITVDYNDYYVSGTGGRLGYYGGNKITLPIIPGQDASSFALNPVLTNPGTTLDTDYKIGVDLIGVNGTGITTDYASSIRNNPTMGAWENPVNKWKGTTSTDFSIASNWTGNSIPVGIHRSIIFDDAPVNDCYLDIDRSFNNITINQATYKLVTNGKKLSIEGNLIFSNGAQIDATSSPSEIIYAGTGAQSINALNYTSGKIYNLTIDNIIGVTLNSDFTVDNTLTINSGRLFTISATRLLNVTGTIINNAGITGLVVKSDATGDGKIINNTSSVPATVELFLTGGIISPTVGIYHYIVPPVASMSIGTVPTVAEVNTALGTTNFTGNLFCFNEPATVIKQNQGWQYFDNYPGTPPGFLSLDATRGYNINFKNGNDIIKFKGLMNGPQHTFNISYTTGNYGAGWNLVGNPYPCDYDLNGVAGLGTVVDGMSNTIYYNSNGTYGYWNVLTNSGSTVGYTDILPPMTGFYVVATNTNFTQLILPVASKSLVAGDTRSQHKGSSTYNEKDQVVRKVKLVLSKESKSDETIVVLADDAGERYNEHYDAFKLFDINSSTPGIYSVLSGTEYFMKAVAGPVSSPVRIPLKVVIKEAGKHEISVTEFDNLFDLRVTLRHGNIKTSLNKNSVYSFTSGAGTFTDFELIFGDEAIKTGEKLPFNGELKTWYNNQYLYINSSSEALSGNCNIKIFDMQGKLVFNDSKSSIVTGETLQLSVNIPNGLYIVNVIVNNVSIKSKFVVF